MATTVDLEETIREAVRRLVEALDPEMVILFGSAARGEFGPDSDLDFLVVVPEERLGYKTTSRAREALRGLAVAKDLCWTTPARLREYRDVRWTIEQAATSEGRVLYDRPAVTAASRR